VAEHHGAPMPQEASLTDQLTPPESESHVGAATVADESAAPAVPSSTQDADDDTRAAALTAAVRRANTILNQGGPHALQRAAKALRAGKLARCDPSTFRLLDSLHPPGRPMGSLPHNRAPEVGSLEKVLGRVLKRVNNGSSPGVSGWNGSHLAAI